MDFEFNEAQSAVRGVAEIILASRAPQPGGPVGEIWPDRGLWSDLAEGGLLGAPLAEDFGGMGVDFVAVCLLLEECGRVRARAPIAPTLLTAMALERFAPADLCAAWLPRIASGEAVLSCGVKDRLGGDGVLELTASSTQSGGFVLSGRQRFVPFGAGADRVLVFAQVGADVACLLVDPRATGVTVEAMATTSGAPEAELVFDGVGVAISDVVAGADQGAAVRRWLWERTVVANAAELSGVAAAALKLTAEYTSTREQFGRPIGSFQAVAMHAANAFIDVEAIRVATLQAAWRLSSGLPAEREVSIAGLWASEAATRVLATASHLHGGVGLLMDYPLHKYLTAAKHLSLAAGSAQWHLARLGDIVAEDAKRRAAT